MSCPGCPLGSGLVMPHGHLLRIPEASHEELSGRGQQQSEKECFRSAVCDAKNGNNYAEIHNSDESVCQPNRGKNCLMKSGFVQSEFGRKCVSTF